jgi:hypothetical protein
MDRAPRLFACCLALGLLAASCGTLGGLGDLGDILGNGGPADRSDIEGTVLRVDTQERRIDLDVHRVNNLQEDRADSSIYYDADTAVIWQGRTYQPEDLERGDQVVAAGSNVGGRYVADEIEVVRNVRS